ncbi:MAG: 23S rRNA (pseudouridine(1915)-N(3))-methyltransferase RlmH [Candidatus Peribacteraceae bacterium]|nr:23S rRNA (pseudouridine(1915)-N(3))-methyltransferase RlmH [Candidatus Peribacteraceae bacterium]
MPVVVLAIGSLKAGWAKEACADYERRLRGFELKELPASREKDPDRQRRDESARLQATAAKLRGELWALDERGEAVDSKRLSTLLTAAADRGETIVLALGGAYGLSDELRAAARRTVRLSDLTLPHELCRVLLLEQLYRAAEIAKGSGYHH